MIHPIRLGLAGGIFWGACLFLTTVFSIYTGYASHWLANIADIYPGFTITWMGSLAGLIYGFIDGFICLSILGWLYNKLDNKVK